MSYRIGRISDLLVDIGNFNRDQKITASSFGAVFRETIPLIINNVEQQVDCAIKIITEQVNSISSVKTFLFEVEAQSSLNHPAILPILGYSLPLCGKSEYLIISPYMPNGTVESKYVKANTPSPFDTNKAIAIFGIAAGMAFVHQNNIIHRDLKPSNILLDNNNHPKITDFAYGKYFVEGTEGEVSMETMVGTPIYMPPEAFMDDISSISNLADVYSFAICLYEILSGHHAYNDEPHLNHIKLYRNVAKGYRPTIDENLIPPIYSELLHQCWSGDPSNRPSFIKIVKDLMDRRDEYFNQPNIDKNQLNNYINEVTKDLHF